MKPKTARRILKKKAWEIAELNTGASVRGKRWLRRLEAKCLRIVADDKMDKVFRRRAA